MYYKLIRKPADGKAVRGRLFWTSHYFNHRTNQYAEVLHPICDTLENADYLVPALIYHVSVTKSPKFNRLLPVIEQVPGKNDVRVIGAPSVNQRSVCDGESEGRSCFCDLAEWYRLSQPPCRTRGCILVTPTMEQELTARLLAEQQSREETRLEICNHTNLNPANR